MYNPFFKRIIDVILASINLVLLTPLFVIITIVLFIANEGEPFFIQKRPGKNGEIFHMIKFKTMTNEKDSSGNLLPDSKRMTKLGNIARRISLDEIPQLINVIRGEMSLVGPRPLLPEYLPLYNEVQKRRHEVKPGMTGWAQVNKEKITSWQTKFEYDLWYIEHKSFLLDLKIVFLTLKKVFIPLKINTPTTESFNGKN
ncbi:lipid carrier--UDP-N-acetylgalactosaminyltransferase [Flavobacterium aquariorum]|uniref:Lipid carrier--UDP-N-acetylgalactosaminyltransferase n=1 Tax=Flavobacterium aquariorum TaxID=2217670 RepID=A0A2W7UIG6_9FLAO|nr:sugar transferase [Flavobacterium aquariorum]PZX94987.1 lipid carrier--UDP-N-acetylgalactosaminyltransferase [Flavobacterium aquariorum]